MKEHSNLTLETVGVKRTIYRIKIDGQISYVGETNNFERRKREHITQLQGMTHKNKSLLKRYAMSPTGLIEIEPIIELPTDNLFVGYFCEGLAISYYQYSVCNGVVIAEGKGRIKLPCVEQDLAYKLLTVLADWYNTTLNL